MRAYQDSLVINFTAIRLFRHVREMRVEMVVRDEQSAGYVEEITSWRQTMEELLRAEEGWLTLTGLYWLHEGINTIGADPTSDVLLPEGAPAHLGVIKFTGGEVVFSAASSVEVTVDGAVADGELVLRDDAISNAPSMVNSGTITFFVIRRGDEYGVRVRDVNNPARLSFTGRRWFPIDQDYRVTGRFIAHSTPRTLQTMNSVGQLTAMTNPGRVEFMLEGQQFSLEAFAAGGEQLWFVFKDGSSGSSTYGAGRFLYAALEADGTVILDFNKAYHPPCAFTPYATCPLPPKENVLPLAVMAGERL